jgi:cation diffusion facilitator family transporter
MTVDKQKAALSSVVAAVFLTTMKIAIGLFTGSLGILSEALHSGLDLCAAAITFFAVKVSDKPADSKHHYGHGKIESFSALIETVLLFVTCGWIIYEAVEKLFFGKDVELIGVQWGILAMGISIVVDVSRVKVLKKAAKEHGSQALEADALHFSSDVWSSSVVIAGLICVGIGDYFNLPLLKYADPIAALGVALLVIKVSFKLGKETIDVLLDTAPKGMREMLEKEIAQISGVLQVADIRIRPSGALQYIDVNVGIDPGQSHKAVHSIVHEIRDRIAGKIKRCNVMVSTFPLNSPGLTDLSMNKILEEIVAEIPSCTHIHNIHVYELGGRKNITAHIELSKNLTLQESHELSHLISDNIREVIKDIDNVNIYFECSEEAVLAEDITGMRTEIVDKIRETVSKIDGGINCHDIRLYSKGDRISTFLHCAVSGCFTVDKLEGLSHAIKYELRKNVNPLENVHIHFEPIEEAG